MRKSRRNRRIALAAFAAIAFLFGAIGAFNLGWRTQLRLPTSSLAFVRPAPETELADGAQFARNERLDPGALYGLRPARTRAAPIPQRNSRITAFGPQAQTRAAGSPAPPSLRETPQALATTASAAPNSSGTSPTFPTQSIDQTASSPLESGEAAAPVADPATSVAPSLLERPSGSLRSPPRNFALFSGLLRAADAQEGVEEEPAGEPSSSDGSTPTSTSGDELELLADAGDLALGPSNNDPFAPATSAEDESEPIVPASVDVPVSAVPAPPALLLFPAGLAGLHWMRGRRRLRRR